MFVDLGYSHLGTTLSIVLLDVMVVFLWWIFYKAGASENIQLLVVVAAGILNTFGLYKAVYLLGRNQSGPYRLIRSLGRKTHMENTGMWVRFREILDNKFNNNKSN